MYIYGFLKSTLLDYPGHLAATIFLGMCNFRCPFCHNGGLVLNPKQLKLIPKDEVLAYLNKRAGILEGVCITGGEPTLSNDLPLLLSEIKSMGYHVKLDTNGSNPKMLESLLKSSLIDYIAMDIKNSPGKYAATCGLLDIDMNNIQASVNLIRESGIDYEFRTTIVKELHTFGDIEKIGQWLTGSHRCYLQSYQDSPDIISPNLYHAHSKETLNQMVIQLQKYIPNTSLRGVN